MVTDNEAVCRRRTRLCAAALVTAAALVVGGCTGTGRPPQLSGTAEPVPTGPLSPRTRLAGLAAAAKDHRFLAGYTLLRPATPARTVTVTMAADGTWRLDIPGGALGGQANIAVAGQRDGVYQCRLGGDRALTAPGCVKVAQAGGQPPAAVDPRVQHPFTDWLDVLTDRQAAVSVTAASLLPGARGACFSVEPNSAALLAPLDAGIYCYDTDGTLTAIRVAFGTLVLATAVAPAPPTASLPGPLTGGKPLPTAAPPPSPSASTPASPAPSARR